MPARALMSLSLICHFMSPPSAVFAAPAASATLRRRDARRRYAARRFLLKIFCHAVDDILLLIVSYLSRLIYAQEAQMLFISVDFRLLFVVIRHISLRCFDYLRYDCLRFTPLYFFFATLISYFTPPPAFMRFAAMPP